MKQGSSLSLRVVIAAILALPIAALVGCGESTSSDYTLSLTVDDTELTADGLDSATVRVTVLDDRGFPPPIGSEVLLQAQNGSVNGADSDAGSALTDAAGTAQFTISCTSESTIRALAVFEGYQGILPAEIICNPPPAGDWQLAVSASPRSLTPNGTTRLFVTATMGDGSPVPIGTAIALQINEPNPGATFRFGAPTQQVKATDDASGQIDADVIAPGTEESFTVCASFHDERFGRGQRCLTFQVGTIAIDEATCIGTYAPSRISGDGVSTSLLTFSVFDDNGQVVSGADIEAVIGLGEFEDPDDPGFGIGDIQLTTDASGTAEVTILAPDSTGTADVDATADWDGVDEPLACIFQESLVYFPPPTCEFDSIGVVDLVASRSIRACFTDFGAPVPRGRRVDFDLVAAPAGTTLTATTAFTDETGCATTGIASGTASGGFTISATMPFGLSEATCQSDAAVQRGGLESANQMVVSCAYKNLGVYLTRNGFDIPSSCSVTCQANVSDQFHNPIEGAVVYFSTEAGSINAVGVTNAAGIASTTFYPRGFAPLDVSLIEGEDYGSGGVPKNPRDSLVTIIASTVGQEMFNDDDGDGVFDDGEYFIDLAEPFVDANDDDVFNEGGSHEMFTDVAVPGRALNGVWDGPNGQWDAFTQIWASTHVVYSGEAVFEGGIDLFWEGDPYDGGAIETPGVLLFEPRDEYGNGLSSAVTFAASTTCSRGEVETSVRSGDRFVHIIVGRVLRNFVAGAEVGSEVGEVDYGILGTFFEFDGLVPYVEIGFKVDDGEAEECQIELTWTEAVSDDCSEGLIENSARFPVALPTRQ